MSRRKITDGLHLRKDGRWERKEKINGKMRWFSSVDPAEVWEKRDAAIASAPAEKEKQDAGPTFNDVADEYEERVLHMKNGTQKSYLPAIRRARAEFGDQLMSEIKPYMIAQFLKSMGASAHTTVSNQKTVINSIFRLWVESPQWNGEPNAAEEAKMPRGLNRGKRQPPTDEQVKIVKDHYLGPDALPAVVFLCTGERRGEACGIKLSDIDFDKGVIHIRRHVEHIGNKSHVLDGAKTEAGVRDIPLLKMLREALEPLRAMSSETYILSGTATPLTASEYKRKWNAFWVKHGCGHQKEHIYNYKNRHGVTAQYHHTEYTADVCAHQFRHEYVCMLAEAGISETIAIQVVGHANMKMIHEVYMALKPKMVENTREALDALIFSPTTPTSTPTSTPT